MSLVPLPHLSPAKVQLWSVFPAPFFLKWQDYFCHVEMVWEGHLAGSGVGKLLAAIKECLSNMSCGMSSLGGSTLC